MQRDQLDGPLAAPYVGQRVRRSTSVDVQYTLVRIRLSLFHFVVLRRFLHTKHQVNVNFFSNQIILMICRFTPRSGILFFIYKLHTR